MFVDALQSLVLLSRHYHTVSLLLLLFVVLCGSCPISATLSQPSSHTRHTSATHHHCSCCSAVWACVCVCVAGLRQAMHVMCILRSLRLACLNNAAAAAALVYTTACCIVEHTSSPVGAVRPLCCFFTLPPLILLLFGGGGM